VGTRKTRISSLRFESQYNEADEVKHAKPTETTWLDFFENEEIDYTWFVHRQVSVPNLKKAKKQLNIVSNWLGRKDYLNILLTLEIAIPYGDKLFNIVIQHTEWMDKTGGKLEADETSD